jgi:hypothetical protein
VPCLCSLSAIRLSLMFHYAGIMQLLYEVLCCLTTLSIAHIVLCFHACLLYIFDRQSLKLATALQQMSMLITPGALLQQMARCLATGQGALSLVSTTEELLDRKVAAPV